MKKTVGKSGTKKPAGGSIGRKATVTPVKKAVGKTGRNVGARGVSKPPAFRAIKNPSPSPMPSPGDGPVQNCAEQSNCNFYNCMPGSICNFNQGNPVPVPNPSPAPAAPRDGDEYSLDELITDIGIILAGAGIGLFLGPVGAVPAQLLGLVLC